MTTQPNQDDVAASFRNDIATVLDSRPPDSWKGTEFDWHTECLAGVLENYVQQSNRQLLEEVEERLGFNKPNYDAGGDGLSAWSQMEAIQAIKKEHKL